MIKKVVIDEEHFDKFENGYEFKKSHFKTDNEIEVRIPFTGYYSLKVKCDDVQVAMAEVLRINEYVGITAIEGSDYCVEEQIIDETYCEIEVDSDDYN